MDPKGKGMVVNDKEKESLFSGSSHKKRDGKKKRRCWDYASSRRRSCRKKQLRLKLSAGDDRRFLFMKLRNYKPT
jgi:hypothetical protein